MTIPWWIWMLIGVAMIVWVFAYVFMLATARYHDRLMRRIGANGRPKADHRLTVTIPILWKGRMYAEGGGHDFEVWVLAEHDKYLIVLTDDWQIWRVIRGVVMRIE